MLLVRDQANGRRQAPLVALYFITHSRKARLEPVRPFEHYVAQSIVIALLLVQKLPHKFVPESDAAPPSSSYVE